MYIWWFFFDCILWQDRRIICKRKIWYEKTSTFEIKNFISTTRWNEIKKKIKFLVDFPMNTNYETHQIHQISIEISWEIETF